jgi:hypothetical protein
MRLSCMGEQREEAGRGGILAQSNNRGARETAVASERLRNNIRL